MAKPMNRKEVIKMSVITESMLGDLESIASSYDSCESFATESMYSGCGGTGCTNQCQISCCGSCENGCQGSCYTTAR